MRFVGQTLEVFFKENISFFFIYIFTIDDLIIISKKTNKQKTNAMQNYENLNMKIAKLLGFW